MAVFNAYSHEEMIATLKQAAPHADIYTDADTLAQHKNDPNGIGDADGDLLAYIEVSDVDDIKGVLATARKYHLPVIPQTTATSTVSGSDAETNALMLSTVKMNRILDISREDQVAVVQPGVINQTLNEAANKIGMFYAPDPGSRPISGIGGNASTNAGGMSTVKYGATRDAVLGLKVVLADGRELKLGGRTFKQAFGYDLTHLFVGSEGTLGIITEITVKLLPIPLGKAVMGLAFFDNMTALSKAVTEVRASGVYPAMLEALDAKTVAALDVYEGTHYAENNGAMLILRLDVGGDEALAATEKILDQYGANHLHVTTDDTEMASIEKLRQDMLPAVFAGNNHVMEDMAVPMSQLAPMMDYITEVADQLHVNVFTAGHAGDGNVHPTLTWPKDQTAVPDNVIQALQLMFRKALALGGTISGEHAVGMLKNQWVNEELGDNVDYVQHQIKSLLDPMGILNPKRKIN
ncbi:FAD-binding oxidoreductase [Furfurilactobacillus curtus]|uniref:FAD-binding protein n=1 Tax=Furfurilactobacillus curtus TaxID=1746200 RepID=A0ABQ5JSJ3_9LACO